MRTFAYENSDHAHEPEEGAAPADVQTPRQDDVTSARTFSYEKTSQAAPQGVPMDALPEKVRELREDPARRMFSPQNDYRDAGLEEAFDLPDVPDEAKAAAAAEAREMFADYGLSTAEAKDVLQLARSNLANPPDEATEARWRDEAWSGLVRAHGGDEKAAQQALDVAKKLLERDPRAAAICTHARLGNHPAFVRMVVEKARSEKARGRL